MDTAALRQKAFRLGRETFDLREAKRPVRAYLRADRTEEVLFQLTCLESHDVGLALAFGDIACFRSKIAEAFRGRLASKVAIKAARGAVWAYDRLDRMGGLQEWVDDDRNVFEFIFPKFNGETPESLPMLVPILASASRFWLAHLLVKYRPAPDARALTADQLDETFAPRYGFNRWNLHLVYHFHDDPGLDATAEAKTLAERAIGIAPRLVDEFGSDLEGVVEVSEQEFLAIQEAL